MPARRPALRGRRAVITLFAAAGVVLTSTPAIAAPDAPATTEAAPAARPTTSAEAAQLIAAKGHELEVITEEFNTAREELAADQAAAAQAATDAETAQATYAGARQSVTSVARTAYAGGNELSSLQAMLTSQSAGEFVDQMATLDVLSAHSTDVLTVAQAANEAATTAQQQAEKTAADAQAALDDVTARQTSLNSQIADYQAQYDALSAAEQQAALAAAAAAHAAEASAAAASSSSSSSSSSASSSSASSSSSSRSTSSSGGSSSAAPTSSSAPAQAVAAAPAPGGGAQTAVNTAMAQLGAPYVWAASGPNSFDCSGLVQYAYAAAGISLPHSSSMQARAGTAVSRSQLQPGDLIAFYSPVSHIGIYIGNGMMVHAPTSGDVVKTVSIDYMGQITAMRRLG